MNLQVTTIPAAGPVIVHHRGSNPPYDSIYLDGVEVARVVEQPILGGSCFFVALDLEEPEARAFVAERDPWTAAVDWLLRRQRCSNEQIARAILDYEKACEAEEFCDARR